MEPEPLTELLRRASAGDEAAAAAFYRAIYAELRRAARRIAPARGAGDETLQATALVHEAWLRLAKQEGGAWSDREHFLRVAARAMRQIAVDHARRRAAQKRGGDLARLELDAVLASYATTPIDLLGLDAALQRLALFDEELARLVELRFFAGLGIEETARAMGVSASTVERGWRTARTWLKGEL